jgi:hypothetical protein
MCNGYTMQFILKATLAVLYGETSIKPAPKKQTVPKPSKTHLETYPFRMDLKETQLSADILAMQHRIRKDKHSNRNAQIVDGIDKEPKDHATASHSASKQKPVKEAGVRMSRKDHWEKLKLEDVQPNDLEAMDLTGLSPSLLAHPEGTSVDYTEKERKMLMELLDEEVLKRRDLRRDVKQWMSNV